MVSGKKGVSNGNWAPYLGKYDLSVRFEIMDRKYKGENMQQRKTYLKRSISVVVSVVLLFVSVIASTESVNAASKFKVTVTKKTIYIGQTTKLKANRNVKWSVSNRKTAKLTKAKKRSVTVKGLKAGTVYVKARSGKKIKKIKITVRSRVPKKINLKTTKEVLGIGEDCTVWVDSVTPSYASSDVEFSSSDPSVVSVSSVGYVGGLKPGTATITAVSKKDRRKKAMVTITVVDARAGTLTVDIDMTNAEKYPAGKTLKAWFQVPVSDENQRITQLDKIKHEAKAATLEEFVTDSSGAKAYYIEWGPDVAPEDRVATLSFSVYRRAVIHKEDLRSREKGVINENDEELKKWLRPTTYSGSLKDGIVKETADSIVAEAKAETVYDKAHAIYLWITENITRDKTMPDRELGDVVKILSSKEKIAGSCIDINSIFVSLCNAEGIPARESFGYKIYEDPAKLGQNCRAEFYLPGYGWVEVDPAMPLGKIMYNEDEYRGANVTKEKAAEWEAIKETYWISGSPDWICQNHGRDLTFEEPAGMNAAPGYMVNEDGSLNHFMFPHGEYDGQYIPGWGNYASEFRYVYTFEPESPFDCGC